MQAQNASAHLDDYQKIQKTKFKRTTYPFTECLIIQFEIFPWEPRSNAFGFAVCPQKENKSR